MPSVKKLRIGATMVAAVGALAFSTVPVGTASAAAAAIPDGPALAKQLVRKVTVDGVYRHLIALQRLSDRTGGTRAASTQGHIQSAEYIYGKLAAAGFTVTRQEFPFVYTQTIAEKLTVNGVDTPIGVMTYSPNTPAGGITAPLAVIPTGSDATPGCEAADFTGIDVVGKIALIQRGGCPFAVKQANAGAVGAIGAVIYNNVAGALNGTLGDPAAGVIPTGGISLADGLALAASGGTAVLDLRELREDRTSYNVIAETSTGRKDNVVMLGAHLDSVPEGGGINDNGSGSAGLLETALQLGGAPKTKNAIRFAWWSAEEFGLIGSTHYVNSLDFEAQLNIALYLNFDMIASPNAAYFVYDGDDSDGVGAGPGPYGSAAIEQTFVDFHNAVGVPTEGSDFTGRSDYGEFIAQGIPAGGLFTGAEGIKTEAQAAKWGGQANVAYDKCYHQQCDNLGNIDRLALERNSDAIAWATGFFGTSTESVNGVPSVSAKRAARQAAMKAAKLSVSRTGVVVDDHDHEGVAS